MTWMRTLPWTLLVPVIALVVRIVGPATPPPPLPHPAPERLQPGAAADLSAVAGQ
jgi:hypothetical protein